MSPRLSRKSVRFAPGTIGAGYPSRRTHDPAALGQPSRRHDKRSSPQRRRRCTSGISPGRAGPRHLPQACSRRVTTGYSGPQHGVGGEKPWGVRSQGVKRMLPDVGVFRQRRWGRRPTASMVSSVITSAEQAGPGGSHLGGLAPPHPRPRRATAARPREVVEDKSMPLPIDIY